MSYVFFKHAYFCKLFKGDETSELLHCVKKYKIDSYKLDGMS